MKESPKASRKSISLPQLSSFSRILYGGFFCIVGLWGLSGCDDDRFRVPEHKARKSKGKVLYKLKDYSKIPRDIPAWSEFAKPVQGLIFQPEPVKLSGVLWLRDSESMFHDFYFQRTNMLATREAALIANRASVFLEKWFGKRLSERVQVILIPSKKTSEHSSPSSRPVIQKPSSQPASKRAVSQKSGLQVPALLGPKIVIYTGTDHFPELSKYGVIGRFIEKNVRFVMTGSTRLNRKKYWRSIVIPAYFRLRGTGAMIAEIYDKTSRTKFLDILKKTSFPSASKLKQLIELSGKGELEPLLERKLMRASMSMIGFLEDAYGEGAAALILRRMQGKKGETLYQAVKVILQLDEKKLWEQWDHYYYRSLWRAFLRGQPKASELSQHPAFQPSKR